MAEFRVKIDGIDYTGTYSPSRMSMNYLEPDDPLELETLFIAGRPATDDEFMDLFGIIEIAIYEQTPQEPEEFYETDAVGHCFSDADNGL